MKDRMLKKAILTMVWVGLMGSAVPASAQSVARYPMSSQERRGTLGTEGTVRYPVSPRETLSRPAPATVTGINVKDFGALCDGSTDDTVAIQNAYAAAAAAMNKQGGAGVVYFPPSSGYCKVSTLHIPSMGYGQGWLTSLFDNGLFVTGTIYPGNNNAFIGRTSNFAAMGNVFLWGPTAEWQKRIYDTTSTANPLVDLDGVTQVYFQGIAFGGDSSGFSPMAIHIHDNNGAGSTTLAFGRCSIMGDFDIDASNPRQVAGFGLHIENTTMGNINVQNFGNITIRDGYMHKITIANTGIPSNGDVDISDMLVEALNDEDFLTVDTTGGPITDIVLKRDALADSVGSVYLLKHVNNTGINWKVNAKISMTPQGNMGSGLIDPESAPGLISLICEGSGCESVLSQAKSSLFRMVGMPAEGPMILFGSEPNLLVVTH